MELYHHCWYLICMLVTSVGNTSVVDEAETLKKQFDPKVTELLILSCLNNMALACHALAHYQRSIQCFTELYIVLESTYNYRGQVDVTHENLMFGSVVPPLFQARTEGLHVDLDMEHNFFPSFLKLYFSRMKKTSLHRT